MTRYTLEDFMAGKPLPEKPKVISRVYHYGVYLSTSNRKLCYFVCKNKVKVCGDIICIEQDNITGQLAVERAQEILQTLEENEPSIPEKPPIKTGEIVIHADHQGQHTALMVEQQDIQSLLLFITSNQDWHPYARALTIEELSLLGFSIKDKGSYFAPVIRANQYIIGTGRSFPPYRIRTLKAEFENKWKK